MKASIITIGDELLIGQVVNTNAAWLGNALSEIGVGVESIISVGDSVSAITETLDDGLSKYDLIIITGGLGPTHDDITKTVISDYFGAPLEYHEEIYLEIKRRFDARSIPLSLSNKSQAMIPAGFEILPNPIGTAPGMWHNVSKGSSVRHVVVLPGVPQEMKVLMTDSVLPRLDRSDGIERIERRTILTTGIGESNLSELFGDLTSFLDDNVKLAYLPSLQGVRLRLTAFLTRDPNASERMRRLEAHIDEKAGRHIFGSGTETLAEVTGRELAKRGLRVAVAESCTGGLVLSHLTDVPGASSYVLGGVVAYDNDIKIRLLGVNASLIETHGSVSQQVAAEMAKGVREKFTSHIGLATSGIMGPGGGTEGKPVGTVWIGLSDGRGTTATLLQLEKNRAMNKERSVTAALNMLRLRLTKADQKSKAIDT